ncbi:MAG: hypothetical protein KatS3mg117_0830 [Geminicoccaceae bacterium]|nr:MAG: hypothetical protein KatS3mg117_0830 [Geminicoccaceae bacterium]
MTSAAVRDSIGEALRLDLVGPAPEDAAHAREVLPRPPSRWYLTGWLVPEGSTEPLELEAEEDLDAGAEDPTGDDTAPEEKLAARVRLLPSSIGLSCLLRAGTERVRVRLDWGEYEPAEEKAESSETALVPVEDPSVETVVVEGEEAGGPTHWRRRPVMRELELSLGDEGGSLPPAEGVELRWLVRRVPQGEREALLLTLFLTNRRAETRPRDLAFLFQPRIEVESDALVGRTDARVGRADDLDSRIAALHYREVREWAVGHGIGAEPVVEPDGSVRRVRTTWMPTTEVARVEARGEVPGERAAERLGRLEAGEVEAALGPLARAYRAWIEEQRRAIATLPEAHRATAEELVAGAERAAERIEAGIARLARDPKALLAFRVANRAIDAAARRRRAQEAGGDPSAQPGLVWRPFQLAFILLNLEGLADPGSEERELVDLLFFPTGGGKTEAYLGLAAFAMVHRRLVRGEPEGLGLSVLMRYTLRLLTLDQLLRASAVVCALELERRKDPARLGGWPFEIGLWVGRAATPNRLGGPGDRDETTAYQRVRAYQNDRRRELPVPIDCCPWCGEAFKRDSFLLGRYRRENGAVRFEPNGETIEDLRLRCVNPECAFDGSEGYLPILTVDESIYRRLPAFLIATVDKFASLPWEGRTSALFGRVGRFDPVRGFEPPPLRGQEGLVAPPDLVIQDELHLVSGPLGTMVGLYETALEAIASRTVEGRTIRPKLVASTATVQRAAEQVKKLYGRARTELFPPPGIERSDSFFARETAAAEGGRRRYLAVAAPGLGAKRVFLRTLSTLLAAAEAGRLRYGDDAADPYLTVVGYFNALRELGSARRIVEGEVIAAVERYGARRHPETGLPDVADRRIAAEPLELTSRVSTAEVAEARRRLATPYGQLDFVDVALATNMISVGLDIPRLGLMLVAGQPKTTSEYIQATSRVGRDPSKPGLVVVLLNLHKPRDRSHLEHFHHYHATFYRSVEATSVTPFATGALDRGLAALLVALARHLDPELWREDAARNIDELERFRPKIAEVLRERIARTGIERHAEAIVAERLDALVRAWRTVVERRGGAMAYGQRPGQGIERLLRDMLEERLDGEQRLFRAPRSMRDVELASWLKVVRPDFTPLPGEANRP